MPVEIKELHIKINVGEGASPTDDGDTSFEDRDKLIAECVEQVMEILAKKEER